MEGIRKYKALLVKYRLVLFGVPVLIGMGCYLIVRNLPPVYPSQARISTGIIDKNYKAGITESGNYLNRNDRSFVNMTQLMHSKRILDLVSYKLIIHDLSSKPFRESELLKNLDPLPKNKALAFFKEKYDHKHALDLNDNYQDSMHRILSSMRYDEESMKSSLSIYRSGISDFIFIDYHSENAELSALVVNTLAAESIEFHNTLAQEEDLSSIALLKNLLRIKRDTLEKRVNRLHQYKIDNRILNLNAQSAQVYSQTAEYELRAQRAQQDVLSLRAAIANLDNFANGSAKNYANTFNSGINRQVISSKSEMDALQELYIQSDFDEKYKSRIDSLQLIIADQITTVTTNQNNIRANPNSSYLEEKQKLRTELGRATDIFNSLKMQLGSLSRRKLALVPHEAVIQSHEREIVTASAEYQDLLTQYNKVVLDAEFRNKFRIAQSAAPGLALPDKAVKWAVLSTILSLLLCLFIFLILFLLDRRIRIPSDLILATKIPVLGYLNMVGRSTLDLQGIWKNLHGSAEMREFKKQLRSTRFEVNRELANPSGRGQILSITSLVEGEGKTLISACIAYTYVMVNKKVLLIDGNFDNPSITKNSNTKVFIEDFLKTGQIEGVNFNSGIMVMGNHGGDKSILEVCEEETILKRLEELRSQFDVILVETPALDALNKAKEWILFTDKTVSVFEAGQTINEVKKQDINYLNTLNGQFIGWIMNKVRHKRKARELIAHAAVIE